MIRYAGFIIIVLTPVSHVFYHSIENNDRKVVRCPLKYENGMREYVYSNIECVKEYINNNIKPLSVAEIDATYLMWIDISRLGENRRDFCSFMREKTGLYVSDGVTFGEEGKDFFRLNVACPRKTLEDGLRRLEAAVRLFLNQR